MLLNLLTDHKRVKQRQATARFRSKNKDRCYQEVKTWKQNNPTKVKAAKTIWDRKNVHHSKNYHLLKTYGMTLKEYEEMVQLSGNTCYVCGEGETRHHHLSGRIVDLAVDHCHKTGKIRGLLCTKCNQAVGLLRDNPKIARSLADYLSSNDIETG